MIRDYVRHIRDKFFGGYGRAVYINYRDQVMSFLMEGCPEELRIWPLPPIEQMVFPAAVVYNEETAYWVDSEGNYWFFEMGLWTLVEGGGFL